MLKGDTVRLQPWFIIRIMILLVAYTNEGHKDYKGDWLHRGLLHCFWRQEISAWNLVFISPGGQFGHRYVIPTATRHIVQSSLKQQDGVSFFFSKMESAWPVPFLPQVHPLPWKGVVLTTGLPGKSLKSLIFYILAQIQITWRKMKRKKERQEGWEGGSREGNKGTKEKRKGRERKLDSEACHPSLRAGQLLPALDLCAAVLADRASSSAPMEEFQVGVSSQR